MTNVNFPRETQVRIGKADRDLMVNLEELGPETLMQLAFHGLKQKLNDAHAGEKDADEAFALAEKALESLTENGFAPGARGARVSEFERECRAIVEQALRAKGVKAVDAKKRANGWREELEGKDATVQKIEAKARKNIEARKADEIELDVEV